MKSSIKVIRFIVIGIISILFLPIIDGMAEETDSNFKFDLQGDGHYSHYNFTDIKKPYDGFDAWAELKFTYQIGENKPFGIYTSIIPSLTSEDEFWWQKNGQISVGLQWYPTETFSPKPNEPKKDLYRVYRGIRFYALYALRGYYDKPAGQDTEDSDIQVGIDYYYDNLNNDTDKSFVTAIWSNAGYRKTNFSFNDYDAFLWSGNIKAGFGMAIFGSSIVLPYAVADWTYSPRYDDRWWENFLRIGGGLKLYPLFRKYSDNSEDLYENTYKRFNIYVEVLHNAIWLGDEPVSNVEETDFRVGVSFSTFFNI